LQELVGYAFEESVRIKKKGSLFPRWHEILVRSSHGILQEVQSLLQKYRSEFVRQSRLLDQGDPACFALINPARNQSIFRMRFPIRSWYPSQHLLRQNPLPRTQFGYRRRFPRAASQPQTVVRPACRGQRSRGPWDDHSQEAR